MLKSVVTACAGALAAAVLSSCGANMLAAGDVEEQILSQLKGSDGSSPDTASCPEDLEAEKGATMTCTATAGGDEFDVNVTVTSVADGEANFDIEVPE